MLMFAAVVAAMFVELVAAGTPAVVARPELSIGNVVRVGETLVIPLYDGKLVRPNNERQTGLRAIGEIRIPKHDLLHDLGSRSMFGGYDVSSDRGEAFVVERAGRGSINVLLRLPQLHRTCVSCRTLHYYYRAT